MKFLDELALQQEGLRFAADDVTIEIVNRLDEGLEFQVPAHAARRLEIVADAFAQIAGFADVNDRAEAVAHHVDPRFVGQGTQLFADGFRQRHATGMLQRADSGLQVAWIGEPGA